MSIIKRYEKILILMVAAAFFAIAYNGYNHRTLDQLISSDGSISVTVHRNGKYGHQIIFDEEHKMHNLGIGGEYGGAAFSPTGRYFTWTYISASDHKKYTELIDFKLNLSGLGAVEITSRIDDDFVPELKDPFILNDLIFDFVRWHETEDYMLYNYTATDINGGESVGFVWYSPEYYEQRLVAINEDI